MKHYKIGEGTDGRRPSGHPTYRKVLRLNPSRLLRGTGERMCGGVQVAGKKSGMLGSFAGREKNVGKKKERTDNHGRKGFSPKRVEGKRNKNGLSRINEPGRGSWWSWKRRGGSTLQAA